MSDVDKSKETIPETPEQEAKKLEAEVYVKTTIDTTGMIAGRIVSVQGPVVDVKFDGAPTIPPLFDVLVTKTFDGREVLLEIAEHLTRTLVRCIALHSTLNLQKNAPAYVTGNPVTIPVGDEVFGRILDVAGKPLDR